MYGFSDHLNGIPRTALSADLHGCSTYSTLVFRASGCSTRLDSRTFVRWARERGRAEVIQHALLAKRSSGVADPPAVQDQPQREVRPLLRRHHLADVLLDLDGVPAVGQLQAVAEPVDVGVHGEAGDAEGDAKDHVCRLPADPRQGDQVLNTRGNFAVEALGQRRRGAPE